jgi:3'(2'), 5'-bisphosphate nucleotidase
MSWSLPESLASHSEAPRVRAALQATMGAGAALAAVRGAEAQAREVGNQLKSAFDRAAEGWVLGFLEQLFPEEPFLAEERQEEASAPWSAPARYWTVDALDGTRSFVEGYPGFCVQVGFVDEQGPAVGVVYEPVPGTAYVAIRGCGAYSRVKAGDWHRLGIGNASGWPPSPRFIDSTYPGGPVGDLMRRHGASFVECGSIGLKICRVAAGEADVFMKRLTFKLWDVAPGQVVLEEAGGALGTWEGDEVDYHSGKILWCDILAGSPSVLERCLEAIAR